MKVLFIEPPKDFWFVMGEYTPPPLGILQLAAFLESRIPDIDIDVLDCQAESVGWDDLKKRVDYSEPDLVVSSALATCNTYTIIRTLETVKKIDPTIKTVVGGQHFTALAQESLENYREIDFIIRGEGELTLLDLVKTLEQGKSQLKVEGLSFRHGDMIIHNPSRVLIDNLNDLPFPGYHFIEENIDKYHFKMMAGP